MRTEREMMELIIGIAEGDDRIRAAYMNGSRTDPNAPEDKYQDYDVVYIVTDTAPFIGDPDWILKFGAPLIVQEPDWNDNQWTAGGCAHDPERSYAWLMLFDDGNRIDLGIEALAEALTEESRKNFLEDKLTAVLLDKDNILPKIPPPSDDGYYVKKPSEGLYLACCNEFWWCLNNVAKGIARDELPYLMYMLNEIVRKELHNMISWHIGARHNFSVNTGKFGKRFKRYLPPDLYAQYAATYPGCGYADIWAAVYAMCDLFHTLATSLAAGLGYTYRLHEEAGSRKYLEMVRADTNAASETST